MPMISSDSPPSSFRHMLKSSICCFTPVGHLPHKILDPDDDDDYSDHSNSKPAGAARSSWINIHDLEIRDRCLRGFVIGGRSGRNRRRYRSEEFRYDPESYSLNFEDDAHRREDELALGGFAARLPATPDRYSAAVESWNGKSSSVVAGVRRTEITAWS